MDVNSPFLTDQIRLSADVDGDGVLDPLVVSMVEAVEDIVGPTLAVGPAPRATSTSISAAPNPFRGLTTFHFSLAESRPVEVAVYDVVGRRVRTLHSGLMEAGDKNFVWDGRDASGRSAGAGIYFIRIESAGLRLGTRVVLRTVVGDLRPQRERAPGTRRGPVAWRSSRAAALTPPAAPLPSRATSRSRCAGSGSCPRRSA